LQAHWHKKNYQILGLYSASSVSCKFSKFTRSNLAISRGLATHQWTLWAFYRSEIKFSGYLMSLLTDPNHIVSCWAFYFKKLRTLFVCLYITLFTVVSTKMSLFLALLFAFLFASSCAARQEDGNTSQRSFGRWNSPAPAASVAQQEGDRYLLGVGKADITGPSVDVTFMGYADADQVGTGIRQRIYSRAFIVGDKSQPKDRIVYLILDIQSGDTAVRDGIIKGLQAMGPEYAVYNKNNVAVTGTHSHSGPGGWTNYFLHQLSTLGFDRQGYSGIVQGALLSIQRAHQSLKEGQLSVGKIRIEDANVNRSPYSYAANPQAERSQYKDDVDKDLTLIRFAGADGKDIGVLTFFATHGTSMLGNNTLVTGDNKGLAAYLFEKQMATSSPGFVAGFSQANVGDVSPNILGAYCEGGPDHGKRCKFEDDTCGNRSQACHARGPFYGLNDGGTKSCFEIGKRQFDKAYSLFQTMKSSPTANGAVPITGSQVRSVHTFTDMSYYTFPHPNGSMVSTCPAALGYGFAAGTSDWPGLFDFRQAASGKPNANPLWSIASKLLKAPDARQQQCQGAKPILLDVGEMTFPYQWAPTVVDMQLLRIGQLILIVSPGEATTMSGRRWKAAISKAVVESKLLSTNGSTAAPAPIVLLGGPANTYTHYIATEEEYFIQRYEGASTLYGPHTLNAYINLTVSNLKHLSTSSASAASIPAGPQPQVNTAKSWNFIPRVPVDNAPQNKTFGDMLKPPAAQYKRGDTASAMFVGASPRNNLRLESTFAAVQMSDAASQHLQIRDEQAVQWYKVRDDSDWDLVFHWRRTARGDAPSEATISWEIGLDVLPGQYRLVYNGDKKDASGNTTAFQGLSPPFVVV
jgi:neutral ceramidase